MAGELAVGTEIAGHRVESVIGRGGMGVVYLAHHLRLDRKVALKILDPKLADDEVFRRRFVRESQLAGALDHPNIITIFDAGEVGGILYISMRYVEGTDLHEVLHRGGPLTGELALVIASQVAAALDAAHAQGLVHRDVKPGNILLRRAAESAEFDRVYLSDFGVTKRLGGPVQTQTGQFLGTIDYMAPEQIRGASVDARADVYSLGCVLYECLSGEVPYPRDYAIGVMYAHLQDPPPRLSNIKRFPEDLDAVIERAMAKRPDDRFASCGELVAAARTALGIADISPEGPPRQAASEESTDRILTRAPAVRRDSPPPETGTVSRPATLRARVPIKARRARRSVLVLVVLMVAGGVTFAVSRLLSGPAPSPRSHGTGPSPRGQSSPSTSRSPPVPVRISWARWRRDASVFGGPGDQVVNRAIANDNVIIAAGYDSSRGDQDPAVWRYDGSSWSHERLSGEPGDQGMAAVDVGGPGFVAVGADGIGPAQDAAVWLSPDGQAWTPVVSPHVLGGPGQQAMRRVVKGGPGLLAVGYDQSGGDVDAAVWESEDGRSWTLQTNPSFGGPGVQEMRSAVPFRSGVVVVGDERVAGQEDAAVWRFDGTAWSRVSPGRFRRPGNQEMVTLARGPGGLVAVGWDDARGDEDAAAWTSPDGTHWTRVPDQPPLSGPGIQEMIGITWSKAGFVAVGEDGPARSMDGAAWISPDGRSWREDTGAQFGGPGIQLLRTVVGFHGKIFALGREHAPGNDDAACWVGTIHRL